MDIVYIGDLADGGTCAQRLRAMQELGHRVRAATFYPGSTFRRQTSLLERLRRRVAGIRDVGGVSWRMVALVQDRPPDLVWIDKGLMIEPDALRTIRSIAPQTLIVGYSPDDMMNPGNQSRQFLAGLPWHDMYFTTKSYGVEELRRAGAPRVEFVGNAYDPALHRPMLLTSEQLAERGSAVGFIGAFEQARANSIRFLAESGLAVRVWGGGNWLRGQFPATMRIEPRAPWGEDYVATLCATDINLCFLRKANRDLQTTRSVEIPACGAFMLAERTDEHLALFEEGKEAAFFSDDHELLEKVRYYLERPQERRAIAEAGRRRCLSSGYSNHNRIEQMLDTVRQLIGERTTATGVTQ